MNNRQKTQLLVLSITIIIAITAIVLSSVVLINKNNSKKIAQSIFTDCIDNVVELKAETDEIGESFGTAILISKEGTFITNAHIITYNSLGTTILFDKLNIRFAHEEEYRNVECIKYDTEKDLAVLKLSNAEIEELIPIKLGDSEAIHSGDTIYAVGNSSNYGIGISAGIISVPLVNITLDEIARSVIQADITITSGNSGGALVNENGELIGITTFRVKDFNGNVVYGIAYSIPVNQIKKFI